MNDEIINSFFMNLNQHFIIFWDIDSRIQSYIIEISEESTDRRIEESLNNAIPDYLKILGKFSKIDEYLTKKKLPDFSNIPACENFYYYVVRTDDKIPYNYYPFGQIFYFSNKILIRVGENLNNSDKEIISELFRWFPISKSYNNQEIIVKRDTQLTITGNLKRITY